MRALPLSRLSRRLRLALGLALGLVMVLTASLTLVVPRLAHAASLSVTDCSSYAASGGLGAALTTAAGNADASNTITFTCDTSGGDLIFPTDYTVAKDLTLDATGHAVTLSGNGASQLFLVNTGVSFSLTNLTLTKGFITGGGHFGGAIASSGTLTVTNCTFTDNSADFGGAISADAGTVTITNSVFTNNTAGNGGGAVALAGPSGSSGTLDISNTTFSENTASSSTASVNGGAIYVDMDSSTITIDGSTFTDNSLNGHGSQDAFGGALYAFSNTGTLDISDTTFAGNAVSGLSANGGALSLTDMTLTISDTAFTGNTTSSAGLGAVGGAMRLNGGSATITGSTFTGNASTGSASSSVAGCISNGGSLTLANSTLTGNSVTSSNNSSFVFGGCLYNVTGGTLTLTNVTLAGNSTTGLNTKGSNLYSIKSVTITNSIIANGTGADNCSYASGLLTDGGHNLESGTSCGFTAASDLQSTDPQLGPLANNGGPTETMALQLGSPAIDVADDSVCASTPVNSVDQRGVTRPIGTHCDIGAYEFIPLPPSTTSLSASATALTCGQQVTLAATVAGARLTPTGTVTFKDGATTLGTATLSGSGTATLATKSLGNGTHSLQAVYGGDSHFSGSSSTTKVTVTVMGCQGLGGLGPAPQTPQQLQAPGGKSHAPRGASASYHGTSDNAPANAGHGSTTPGLPFAPIALFVLLLLALGGGFVGLGLWRRRQARG